MLLIDTIAVGIISATLIAIPAIEMYRAFRKP